MISIKINDINNFMQNLLVKDTFDSFLICSGEIITILTKLFLIRMKLKTLPKILPPGKT